MLASCLALLAALQADPPAKPAQALDSKDPQSVVEHAVYNTRTQKSYETAFIARMTVPIGSYDYKGRSLWVSPDILYLQLNGSGGNEQKVVRAGEKAIWTYHSLSGEWPTVQDWGDPGAGRGVQNPDEVLAVLSKHTATAKFLKSGALSVTFTGDDLVKIMKGQGIPGEIDPKNSGAKVELMVDGENRVQKISCDVTIVTQAGDRGRYTSEVTVTAYNGATELVFTDENKKAIPLPTAIKERIEAVLKSKK